MTLPVVLVVGILGGLGAIARFAIDGAVAERMGGAFPWGTLAVNASGAALLGLITGLALHGDALLYAGTALIGAYTTFSTWMLETARLAEDGRFRLAALNVVASVAIGLAAVELGRLIGELL